MTKMTKSPIQHHLTPDLMLAYSAGSLPEAFSLVVATHISLCDDCRAELASLDTIGGTVLETTPEAELSAGALGATLALIAADAAKVTAKPGYPQGILPAPLQDYVGGDLAAVKWRSIGMGAKQAILPTSRDATARLLYIPAGCAMPDHGHNGIELTLVLQGAFHDAQDRFARGDVEVANEEVEHTPIADFGEDCICLAATDAPLKFNSLIPRLTQRFLRI